MKFKLIILLAIFIIGLGAYWVVYLAWAHRSFDNYYKFRGCTELVSKTDDAGLCKIKDGSTIKLVKYQNKWYLDGDLPSGRLFDL